MFNDSVQLDQVNEMLKSRFSGKTLPTHHSKTLALTPITTENSIFLLIL